MAASLTQAEQTAYAALADAVYVRSTLDQPIALLLGTNHWSFA